MVSEIPPKPKVRLRVHRRRLLATLLMLVIFLLLCNWSIQPFVAYLDALDRANSGLSQFDDIQITETNARIVPHDGVVSVDNCDGTNSDQLRSGGFSNTILDITVTEPFNTSMAHMLLENKYKFPGMEWGTEIIVFGSTLAAPGTKMQFTWSQDEQRWTGNVTSKSQQGISTYVVKRWFPLKTVSTRNLGCVF